MALSGKRRGFKTLVIEGRTYSWRLNERSGFVEVSLSDGGARRLEIDFGWYDPWLYQPGKEPNIDSEPKIVTPRFIESAIRFAVEGGWNPEVAAPAMRLIYRDEVFRLGE